MSEEETARVWLVEREYSDKGMINLVYAATDGRRHLRRQLSEQMLTRTDVTAALDVDPDRLEPTHEDDQQRYATEAGRMAERHDPEDPV
jgi:hypothetical protein